MRYPRHNVMSGEWSGGSLGEYNNGRGVGYGSSAMLAGSVLSEGWWGRKGRRLVTPPRVCKRDAGCQFFQQHHGGSKLKSISISIRKLS
jgi:hypothetical protein